MSLRSNFGATLREIREGKGLTQSDIGEQRHISALETGRRLPSWETVDEIAVRLRTHPLGLLGGVSLVEWGKLSDALEASKDRSADMEHRLRVARQTLSDLRKEVRSGYAKNRIDNALRETEP